MSSATSFRDTAFAPPTTPNQGVQQTQVTPDQHGTRIGRVHHAIFDATTAVVAFLSQVACLGIPSLISPFVDTLISSHLRSNGLSATSCTTCATAFTQFCEHYFYLSAASIAAVGALFVATITVMLSDDGFKHAVVWTVSTVSLLWAATAGVQSGIVCSHLRMFPKEQACLLVRDIRQSKQFDITIVVASPMIWLAWSGIEFLSVISAVLVVENSGSDRSSGVGGMIAFFVVVFVATAVSVLDTVVLAGHMRLLGQSRRVLPGTHVDDGVV